MTSVAAPVEVWRIELVAEPSALVAMRQTLSAAERAKADRFVFPRHRLRYTVAHAALREILGRASGRAPQALEFVHGPHGKPSLADGSLEFNLSHSEEQALVAVSHDAIVGVDIEYMRSSVDYESVARHVFSAAEQRALAAMSGPSQREAFFRTWSRKEAFIKALGEGLARQLDSFDVPLDPSVPAAVAATRPDAHEAEQWRMWDLPAPPGFMAAVVLAADDQAATWTEPAPPKLFRFD